MTGDEWKNKRMKVQKERIGAGMPGDRRFAVLIDADNISNKYVKVILDEISNDGVATYKRIYGDWTRSGMGPWKRVLLEHSITPIQQYGYTTGKNATDSAMIIDAMDILYSGNVEGFCLVSSDSDFTRLASRLRESGMMVVGMGEQKTPKAFISACNKFKYLDILSGQAAPKTDSAAELDNVPKDGVQKQEGAKFSGNKNSKGIKNQKAEREATVTAEKAAQLEQAAAEKAAAEKAASPKEKERLGKGSSKKKNRGGREERVPESRLESSRDFPLRPETEPEREPEVESRIEKDPKTGKYKPQDVGIILFDEDDYDSVPAEMTSLETIKQAVATIVAENADEDEWIFIGDLGNRLTKRYPDFDVRNYGFSKLTPFIKSLDLFDIKSEPGGNSNNKLVYVRERE